MHCPRRRPFFLALLLLAGMQHHPRAVADPVFVVDTPEDRVDEDVTDGACRVSGGGCSLRAAIMQANHLQVAEVQIEVPAGTYVLSRPPGAGGVDETGGDLDILPSDDEHRIVWIRGAGASLTVIDGNHTDRVMAVAFKAIAILEGLTIQGGSAMADPAETGGGIRNFGSLTLSDCIVTGNASSESGGGIGSTGTLVVDRSTLSHNASRFGGGLVALGATRLYRSLLAFNAADTGGGAYVTGFGSFLYAVNTTFSSNSANGDGGGIANEAATFLYNVSIVNNDADHDRDETGGIGGGVYAKPSTTLLPTRFLVANTLIANNTILDAPIADNCNGLLEDYGLNLLDDRTGCVATSEANLGVVSAASIGTLQDNGGPTLTHALLAGSEAIDSTFDVLGCVDETGAPLGDDQRGAPRPAGVRCDVGAFESGSAVPTDDVVFRDGFEGAMRVASPVPLS